MQQMRYLGEPFRCEEAEMIAAVSRRAPQRLVQQARALLAEAHPNLRPAFAYAEVPIQVQARHLYLADLIFDAPLLCQALSQSQSVFLYCVSGGACQAATDPLQAALRQALAHLSYSRALALLQRALQLTRPARLSPGCVTGWSASTNYALFTLLSAEAGALPVSVAKNGQITPLETTIGLFYEAKAQDLNFCLTCSRHCSCPERRAKEER